MHQKNSKPEMVTIVKREAVSNTEKEERTKEVANNKSSSLRERRRLKALPDNQAVPQLNKRESQRPIDRKKRQLKSPE